MDLIIVKSGVDYGTDGTSAITDIANVATLEEGAILGSYENGSVILATGLIQGGAAIGKKSYLHYNRGELKRSVAIDVATAKLVEPLGTTGKVAQVQTFNAVLGTITDGRPSGVLLIDISKNIHDKTREEFIDIYVDADTVKADFYVALAAKIAENDKVATCTNSNGVLTITSVAGENITLVGTGYNEGVSSVVTTPIGYGTLIDADSLLALSEKVKGSDGAYDTSMCGAPDMFNANYGIEAGVDYNMYVIEYASKPGYTANDGDVVPAFLYVAIPNGQEAVTGESYVDILNALCGNVADTDV